jgi:hypothetical protein
VKRNAVLVALLAVVLADAAANAGVRAHGLGSLGALAGGLVGRAVLFLAVLLALHGLRLLAASGRGALMRLQAARVGQARVDRGRVRRGTAVAS